MTVSESEPRQKLLAQLLRYQQRYPEEADCCERFLTFIDKHSDCFERSLALGHITGSSWILNQQHDAVLLLHHAKLNRWLQPGGHADGDSDVYRVAAREAFEETGLPLSTPIASAEIFDIDIHEIPARAHEPAHLHFDIRIAFTAPLGFEPVCSTESNHVKWISLTQVPEITQEHSILRMIAKTPSLEPKR